MLSGTIYKSAFVAALLALAACATSPVDEQRRKDMEADIDEILSYELDETEFGEPKNCLSKYEYRSFRALGDRHILFEGRNDKQWVNVLSGRCAGMRENSTFIMKPAMSGRTCDRDRFEVVEQSSAFMTQGSTCLLGQFKPVSEGQIEELEKRLEMR
jgi:hypothetical protein